MAHKLKNQTTEFMKSIGIIIVGVLIGTIVMLIISGILLLIKLPVWLMPIIILLIMFYFLWRSCGE